MKGRKMAAPQMAEGMRIKRLINKQVETKERRISAKTENMGQMNMRLQWANQPLTQMTK